MIAEEVVEGGMVNDHGTFDDDQGQHYVNFICYPFG